jgi:phosphatidylglycerophosphatase A
MAPSPNRSRQQLSELPIVTRFIATGFFSGYSPFAPGTAGSAVALVFFLIPAFGRPEVLLTATLAIFFLGAYAADAAEKVLGKDPSPVTIDEVAGMWLSLWFLPQTVFFIIAAFFLFRFFDIIKPFPASYFDNKAGGWNIMLDDVMAGLYTNLLLQAIHYFL